MQAYTQAERPTIRTERVVPGGHDVEGTAFKAGDGDWVVLQGGDLDVHSPPVVHWQAQEHSVPDEVSNGGENVDILLPLHFSSPTSHFSYHLATTTGSDRTS